MFTDTDFDPASMGRMHRDHAQEMLSSMRLRSERRISLWQVEREMGCEQKAQ
jgi:hypothetical protein